MNKAHGFTIVELLIVIVVIAILAALSYVGYTNISQRANNAAVVSAASQSLKAIQAYIAESGTYPRTHATGEVFVCITAESGCRGATGNVIATNSTFNTNMASIGSLPQSVPVADSRSGVIYFYRPNAITIGGSAQSAWLVYWLEGTNQNCGASGVLSASSPYTASSNNYSDGNEGGKTRCNVLIPGPAHAA